MKKSVRAQVTVFVIVGLLIIGAVAGGVYIFRESSSSKIDEQFFSQVAIKPQFDNIHANVVSCIDDVCDEGLRTIGVQGGYYNKPEKFFDLGWAFVPYYYYVGDYLMPERGVIVDELSEYVEDNLEVCLDGLNYENFEIGLGMADVDVLIDNDFVKFDIDVPVVVGREGHKIDLDFDDYSVVKNSALSDILDIAEYITESHKDSAKTYCINCVGEMAEERDVYIQTANLPDESVYIIIGENRTGDEPYLFSFLNKYSGNEIDVLIDVEGFESGGDGVGSGDGIGGSGGDGVGDLEVAPGVV